ncbi:hypothetical protein ACIPRL_35980 [Streptomyces sp. NPDC090085]|uniref:hypothetical protein n=1 Tax=Streptomyces sp. NPDC090085 TaxID=3365943 RepID=UPI00382FF13A
MRIFTDLSAPLLATSWALLVLAVLLTAAGWVTARRHGMRGTAAWCTCVLAHVLLALQLYALIAL